MPQIYYRQGDGVLATRVSSDTNALAYPDEATRLTKKQYEAQLANVQAARQEHAAELTAGEEQRRRDDYEALIALRMPEASARRLSGYTGEDSGPGAVTP